MKKIIGFLIVICLFFQVKALADEARITIESSDLTDQDTLELLVWGKTGGMVHKAPHWQYKSTAQNGICVFTIDKLEDIAWMSLSFTYQRIDFGMVANGIFEMLPLEKGDNVWMKLYKKKGKYLPFGEGYVGGEPRFEGNWGVDFLDGEGYHKMETAYKLQKLLSELVGARIAGLSRMENAQLAYDLKLERAKTYLNDQKNNFSGEMYKILLFECMGRLGENFVQTISRYVGHSDNQEAARLEVKPKIDAMLNDILTLGKEGRMAALKSPAVLGYWKSLIHLNGMENKDNSNSLVLSINWVNQNLKDIGLRDQLWLELMLDYFYTYADKGLYDLVMDNMQSDYGLQRLKGLELLVNQTTRLEFDLPDDKGKRYTMQDFKGKVVLIDFWYMACIPCRNYIEVILKPLLAKMKGNSNFEVILISLDDQKTLQHLIKEGVVPNGAISLYTDNLRFKHPLTESLGINGYPFPMLIDKEGRIAVLGKRLNNLNSILEEIGGLIHK